MDLFPESEFAGDLENSKWTSGQSHGFSHVEHLFPEVGCAKNKHQSRPVLQNRKFSSYDASLRLDGILALDLWDVVIDVLHSSKNLHQKVEDRCRRKKVDDQVQRSRARSETQSTNANTKSIRNSNREVDELSYVDYVVTSESLFISKLSYTFLKTMRL